MGLYGNVATSVSGVEWGCSCREAAPSRTLPVRFSELRHTDSPFIFNRNLSSWLIFDFILKQRGCSFLMIVTSTRAECSHVVL